MTHLWGERHLSLRGPRTLTLTNSFTPRRVNNIANLTKPNNALYALHTIPKDATWGKGDSIDKDFITYDGQRLKILVVGFVNYTYFFDMKRNKVPSSCTIRIHPIVERVIPFSKKLLYDLGGFQGVTKRKQTAFILRPSALYNNQPAPSSSQATMDDMVISFTKLLDSNTIAKPDAPDAPEVNTTTSNIAASLTVIQRSSISRLQPTTTLRQASARQMTRTGYRPAN